jgi:hypothetical protein
VVLGVIVAAKKNMRLTSDLSFKLLRLAHATGYVKVGLDDDEDLYVRTELRVRMLDLEDFQAAVEDVNSDADKAAAEVKPFLITP